MATKYGKEAFEARDAMQARFKRIRNYMFVLAAGIVAGSVAIYYF